MYLYVSSMQISYSYLKAKLSFLCLLVFGKSAMESLCFSFYW